MREQQQLQQAYADYLDGAIDRLTCRLNSLRPIYYHVAIPSSAAAQAACIFATPYYCCVPGALPYAIANGAALATCTGTALFMENYINALRDERQFHLSNRDRLRSGDPLLPLPNNALPNNGGNSQQNIQTEFDKRIKLIATLLKKLKEHARKESTPELELIKERYRIEIYKKITAIAINQKFNQIVRNLLSEKNIPDEYLHTIANTIRQIYMIEEGLPTQVSMSSSSSSNDTPMVTVANPPTQVSMSSSSSSNDTPMVTVANPPTQVSMLSSSNPEPLVPQPAIIGNQRL